MQLKRYFDTFKPDQIKVYLYEDLNTNPISVLQDIFQFLNVDQSFVLDTTLRHNIFGIAKNNFVGTLMQCLKPLNPVLKQFFSARLRQNIKNKILVKPQLPTKVRQQLIEVYRGYFESSIHTPPRAIDMAETITAAKCLIKCRY